MNRTNQLKTKRTVSGVEVCADCGGFIETGYEWLGENEEGMGQTMHHDRCEDCGRWVQHIELGG